MSSRVLTNSSFLCGNIIIQMVYYILSVSRFKIKVCTFQIKINTKWQNKVFVRLLLFPPQNLPGEFITGLRIMPKGIN